MQSKVYAGEWIRNARQLLGWSQRELANRLGISYAYLSQIEKDVRPVSESIRFGVRAHLGLDLLDLVRSDQAKVATLEENLFARPLTDATRQRLARAIEICPELADAILNPQASAPERPSDIDAYSEIGDWFYLQDNHIETLDRAAEELFHAAGFRYATLDQDLVAYIRRFGIQVDWVDDSSIARQYDPDNKRVTLGRWLEGPQRAFQLAQILMWQTQSQEVKNIVRQARLTAHGAEDVLRIGLANYFAGALVMPYTDFLKAAQAERYDLERLQRIFHVSFESASHRLSTLQRPGNSGVPFYFVRVDAAGQIMKRQSPAGFHFARKGGACPLWNVHEALTRPDQILIQRVSTPDSRQWLCLARAVIKPGARYGDPDRRFSVGIGCESKYADQIVYADGINMEDTGQAVAIGPGCRHCLRPHCPQRAFPPLGRQPDADIHQRARIPLRWND